MRLQTPPPTPRLAAAAGPAPTARRRAGRRCQHGIHNAESSPSRRLLRREWGNPRDVWRILLVDDRESVREVLRLYADGRGLTVVGEAADGDAALEAARKHRPHAVVLDQEMPGRTGLEVLPALVDLLP